LEDEGVCDSHQLLGNLRIRLLPLQPPLLIFESSFLLQYPRRYFINQVFVLVAHQRKAFQDPTEGDFGKVAHFGVDEGGELVVDQVVGGVEGDGLEHREAADAYFVDDVGCVEVCLGGIEL
jgi:hypothetical protein